MSYACIAMVTDYDCWHPGHAEVDIEQIIRIAHANAATVRELVGLAVPRLAALPDPPSRGVLRGAVMTPPDRQPACARARIEALLDEA